MSIYTKYFRFIKIGFIGIVVAAALFLSFRVSDVNIQKLVTSLPKASKILSQFFSIDVLDQVSETYLLQASIPIPCGSAPEPVYADSGPRIVPEINCAESKQKFMVYGYELDPNISLTLRWRLPSGDTMTLTNITTDVNGEFAIEVQARPIVASQNNVASTLEIQVDRPGGKWVISSTFKDVVDAMFITIFMALLATTFGTLFALPLGFLGASNISRHGVLGNLIYYIDRSILNVVRSYEPLVMATVFALIVGFGTPYAGVLALVLVTTASLGKMFSEAVESIDPGPIEALRATGATPLQVVVYAIIPQIIPDFLSFTIYHWDINVRISTIIGFVGGGGIGYYLSQRINTFEYSKAGTALLAIIVVVWALDFLSARIRKELV